jgi:hypothetical protein
VAGSPNNGDGAVQSRRDTELFNRLANRPHTGSTPRTSDYVAERRASRLTTANRDSDSSDELEDLLNILAGDEGIHRSNQP